MEIEHLNNWNTLLSFLHSNESEPFIDKSSNSQLKPENTIFEYLITHASDLEPSDSEVENQKIHKEKGPTRSAEWWKRWLRYDAFVENEELPRNILGQLHNRITREVFKNEYHKYKKFSDKLSYPTSNYKSKTDFVGREKELNELATTFSRTMSSVNAVCISANVKGIGGMGKTTLVKYYAEKHANEYASIFFLNGRNNILDEFIQRIKNRYEEMNPKNERECFEQLFRHLRHHKILIIIDDVDISMAKGNNRSKSEREITALLNAANEKKVIAYRTNVIVTSRGNVLSNSIHQHELKKMNLDDAVSLFQNRRGNKLDDEILVKQLVGKVLNGHPLSICLVASYAKEQNIEDLSIILEYFKTQAILDATPTKTELPDYHDTLIKALELNFKVLSTDTRYALFLLSLFRRGLISATVLKNCVNCSADWMIELQPLVDSLKKGGNGIVLKELNSYCFLEDVPGEFANNREKVFQLHEVVYDFTLLKWATQSKNPELISLFENLETAFTQSASSYISQQIRNNKLTFRDVYCLLGILFPLVSSKHNISPSTGRIKQALEFWYQKFHFQNYSYDTGVLTLFQDRLLDLQSFIHENTVTLKEHHHLVLQKIILHNYYANPSKNEKEIEKSAIKALNYIEKIEDTSINPIAEWYRVFILDHRSNAISKGLPLKQALKHATFYKDIREIEGHLPKNLKCIHEVPRQQDLFLLLRAAHFWGHRGNQDADFAFELFKQRASSIQPYAEQAIKSYEKAINYRLAVYKIFNVSSKKNKTDDILSWLFNEPYIADWLKDLDIAPFDGAERFTSIAQAIGDVAHQYRGINFVQFLQYLSGDCDLEAHEIQPMINTSKTAIKLWNTADRRLIKGAGEISLKYKIWMASTLVWMDWAKLPNHLKRNSLASWANEYEIRLEQIIKDRREGDLGIEYLQKKAMTELHQILDDKYSK